MHTFVVEVLIYPSGLTMGATDEFNLCYINEFSAKSQVIAVDMSYRLCWINESLSGPGDPKTGETAD